MRSKDVKVSMERSHKTMRYRVTAINGALSVAIGPQSSRRLVGVGDEISMAQAYEIEKLLNVTVSVKLSKEAI